MFKLLYAIIIINYLSHLRFGKKVKVVKYGIRHLKSLHEKQNIYKWFSLIRSQCIVRYWALKRIVEFKKKINFGQVLLFLFLFFISFKSFLSRELNEVNSGIEVSWETEVQSLGM